MIRLYAYRRDVVSRRQLAALGHIVIGELRLKQRVVDCFGKLLFGYCLDVEVRALLCIVSPGTVMIPMTELWAVSSFRNALTKPGVLSRYQREF